MVVISLIIFQKLIKRLSFDSLNTFLEDTMVPLLVRIVLGLDGAINVMVVVQADANLGHVGRKADGAY